MQLVLGIGVQVISVDRANQKEPVAIETTTTERKTTTSESGVLFGRVSVDEPLPLNGGFYQQQTFISCDCLPRQ